MGLRRVKQRVQGHTAHEGLSWHQNLTVDCVLSTLTNKRDKGALATQVFISMHFGNPGQQGSKQTSPTKHQNIPKRKQPKMEINFSLEEANRGGDLTDFTQY